MVGGAVLRPGLVPAMALRGRRPAVFLGARVLHPALGVPMAMSAPVAGLPAVAAMTHVPGGRGSLTPLFGDQGGTVRAGEVRIELADQARIDGAADAQPASGPPHGPREDLVGVAETGLVMPVVVVRRAPGGAVEAVARARCAQQRTGRHDRVEVVVDGRVMRHVVRTSELLLRSADPSGWL